MGPVAVFKVGRASKARGGRGGLLTWKRERRGGSSGKPEKRGTATPRAMTRKSGCTRTSCCPPPPPPPPAWPRPRASKQNGLNEEAAVGQGHLAVLQEVVEGREHVPPRLVEACGVGSGTKEMKRRGGGEGVAKLAVSVRAGGASRSGGFLRLDKKRTPATGRWARAPTIEDEDSARERRPHWRLVDEECRPADDLPPLLEVRLGRVLRQGHLRGRVQPQRCYLCS